MNINTSSYGETGNTKPVMQMTGGLLVPGEKVIDALHRSRLTESLRSFEVELLASLITIKYLEAGESTVVLDYEEFRDALMILVEGQIEVSALVDNEPVFLVLDKPGDLARIMSFVSTNAMRINAMIRVRKSSAIMLLHRPRLETLLSSHPSVLYYVMRNLVSHVHGVVRRNNAEKEEMSNYFYRINGRY